MFDGVDTSQWPWYAVAAVVVVAYLPKAVESLGKVVPPLGNFLQARENAKQAKLQLEEGRTNTVLQHVLTADTRDQMTQVQLQDRMLSILEASLEKMWSDRDATHAGLGQIREQISQLRQVTARYGDILSVNSSSVAKLSDEVEGLKVQSAGLSERVNSLGAWAEARTRMRKTRISES